jgi:hypothetical protein
MLIDQAFAMGFLTSLDIAIRGWLDTIAAISNVIAHSHALMLFDLQVERDEHESHHVSELRAALVMRTQGNNKAIEKRIQHLLDSYTNQSESTLDSLQIEEHTVHRLKDRRLADWVVPCWASVGDYFVVAIGEESMKAVIAAVQSKIDTIWQDPSFREGVEALSAQNALITVYSRFDEIRKKSRLLGAKLQRVQAALAMPDCEQGVWAAGYSGRSMEIRQWLRSGDKGMSAVIAGGEILGHPAKDALPEGAQTFAAIGIEPSEWFERFRNAYLAARSRKNAAESRAYWGEVERSAGLHFAVFFSRLGGPILIHDFPEHALRMPPAWTLVVPVADSQLVRRDVDAILSFWQKELEGQACGLVHTTDGIWFLKVGLEGPALTVTDRHLLISFSPYAVRQNLEELNPR